MKLLKDNFIISKEQFRKIFLVATILIISLYSIAAILSLCGSDYFILNYHNAQMDRIENFLNQYNLMSLINWSFSTIEFTIILFFVINKIPKWYYPLTFYSIPIIIYYLFGLPEIIQTIIPFIFYFIVPIIEQIVDNKKSEYNIKFSIKKYFQSILNILIVVAVSLILQIGIYCIKTGYVDIDNHIMTLSATFVYAMEYDIALLIILFTIRLFKNREKGDNKLCTQVGGFSQTSKTQLQKSKVKKNLTKTQKNKIFFLYLRMYFIQIGTFILVMTLPFLLGKSVEFLVMYLSFCIIRYLLGFNYSLHFKKEQVCAFVGIIVFGFLSLVIPFFYVNLILAIIFGVGLAVVLHLSYKYKGFYLFTKIAKPDKFALLYTFFDGDITEKHVSQMCKHNGLDKIQTNMIVDFTNGNKISYLAWKYKYSQRMMIYKLDEAIEKLIE